MPTKSLMLGELSERELLLPVLVNDSLAANDRAKYLLTLLQQAFAWGKHPSGAPPTLRQERLAAGMEEPGLDAIIAGAHALGDVVWIPRVPELHDRLMRELRIMLAPLELADEAGARPLAERLDQMARRPLGELVGAADIAWLTSGLRDGGDSIHLLVMDLHQRLNALQASLATEAVDGARAYGLDAESREHVAALMAGLNRTAPLKFEHPGLGTTATRSGERLIIQNDIGTSDVHVLVVHVEGLAARVTYSDLHAPRLAFFRTMLDPFGVDWTSAGRREAGFATEEGTYELLIGNFAAGSREELRRFLEHLGSRLVFLIDWNRARKRLRHFVGKADTVALLQWAAAEELGHVGFLKLGGEQAVYEALETSRVPLRVGERLDQLLGRERAVEFLRFVLRAASVGLRLGRSTFLVRDEVRAELAEYLRTAEQSTLTVAVEHASLIVELSAGVRDALEFALTGDTAALARAGARAQRWEHRADEFVNQARTLARRWPRAQPLQRLLTSSDDIADNLEEAAFLLTLPFGAVVPGSAAAIRALAEQVVRGAEEYLKALECARGMQQGRSRDELDEFLAAVDEVVRAEHSADDATRRVKAVILTESPDFRQLSLLGDVARRLEDAADQLMHVALTLRVQVLGEAAE